MLRAYYRWLLRYRWGVLLALAGVTGWFGSFLWPPDEIAFDFSFNRMFLAYGGDRDTLREFHHDFGDDVGVIMVLFTVDAPDDAPPPAPERVSGTVFDPDVMRGLVALSRTLKARPEINVEQVFSLAQLSNLHAESIQPDYLQAELAHLDEAAARHEGWSAARAVQVLEGVADGRAPPEDLVRAVRRYQRAKASIMRHRLYIGQVIAPDARATSVIGRFRLDHRAPERRETLVRALPGLVEGVTAHMPLGVRAYTTGVPVVEQDYNDIMGREMVTYIPIIAVVMSIFLFLLFRHVHAMLLPMIGVGLATVWGIGFMQQQGEPINVISSVIPVIVLVIGVAETVHILARYYQIAHDLEDHRQAIVEAMVHMTWPCLLASATTAAGFGSLVSATIPTIRSFGIYSGLGIMAVFMVQVTFLPVGLSFAPRPKTALFAERRKAAVGRWLDWLTFQVTHRAKRIVLLTAVVGAVSVGGISLLEVESRMLMELSPDSPTAEAVYAVEENLSGLLVHAVTFHGVEYPDQACASDRDCVDPQCDPAQCGFPDCCHTRICRKVDRAWRLVADLHTIALDLTDTEMLPLYTGLQAEVSDLRAATMGTRGHAPGPGKPAPGAGAAPEPGDELVIEDGEGGEGDELVIEDDEGGEGEEGDELVIEDDGDAAPAPSTLPAPAAAERPKTGFCAESIKNAAFVRSVAALDDWLTESEEHRALVGEASSLADLLREVNLAFAGPEDDRNYRLPDDLDRAGVSQLLWPLESAGGDTLSRRLKRDYTRTNVTIYAHDVGTQAWLSLEKDLKAKIAELFTNQPGVGDRFETHITGTSTLLHGALSMVVRDMVVSILVATLFILVLLTLLFRSLRIGLVSMIPNGWPILVTLATMGYAGIELRVSSVIIFSVSLGIAVDDTIHFLARLGEELRRGDEPEQAIARTVHGTGRALVLMTIILCSGFLVQANSDFIAMMQFGLLASFTLLVALVGDLFVLPALVPTFKLDKAFRRER